jgi:uncharacterized membrane protein
MSWIQKYTIQNYFRSSLWPVPLAAAVAAVLFHRLIWEFDLWTRWKLLGFTPDGARAVVGAITASGLTFIIFLLGLFFIAVQIAAGQLTPRITARVFEARASKISLGFFIFTYVFSIGVGGRLVEPIPQFAVLLTVVFTLVSIGLFLFLVGFIGKGLRPISVYAKVADETIRVVEDLYPALLMESKGALDDESFFPSAKPSARIHHRGRSEVFRAFDAEGLAEAARKYDCVIQLVPQAGDFVVKGDPLFYIYPKGGVVPERELQQSVAFGADHTLEQNPAFGFRIIVDIAIRALSPAVNDPTTAVRGVDQIHNLLRMIGERDLGDGLVRDKEGRPRLVFPTRNWEDFIWLGVSEIRTYGAGSLQVQRRLRGMLENLIEVLPPERIPPLQEQVSLLERAAERNFPEPEERKLAGTGDYQGIGGSRWRHTRRPGARGSI